MFTRKAVTYFDYAATTPFDPKISKAMSKLQKRIYANPGSLHSMGEEALSLLLDSRENIGSLFSVNPEHVIFTRGGTEANNMVLQGVILKQLEDYQEKRGENKMHAIMSGIEHSSVRKALYALEASGMIEVSEISTNTDGVIDLENFKKLLRPETVLVSCMYVNNETGVVQSIRDIAKAIRHYKKHNSESGLVNDIYFHVDAAQAFPFLSTDMRSLGADFLTVTASKIYGPKGVGILLSKNSKSFSSLSPIMFGGQQEFGLRPGTEDVVEVYAGALAFEKSYQKSAEGFSHISQLQEFFESEIKAAFPEVKIYGEEAHRSPHISLVGFEGLRDEQIVLELDAKGFAVGSRSACQTRGDSYSHVIESMYGEDSTEVTQWGRVRISFGASTTLKDVKRLVAAFKKTIPSLYKAKEIEQSL